MHADQDLPNPEEKKEKILNLIQEEINNGNLFIPPNSLDDIEELLQNIEMPSVIDDQEPCRGRSCRRCKGCFSIATTMEKITSVLQKNSDRPSSESLDIAGDAVDNLFRHQNAIAKFSKHDVFSYICDAVKEIFDVDLRVLKKNMREEIIPPAKISKEDWEIIRLSLIFNGIESYLDDILVQEDKRDENSFRLLHQNPKGEYYPHGSMMNYLLCYGFENKEDNIMSFLNTKSKYIKDSILRIQNMLEKRVQNQAYWVQNYSEI